MFKYIFTIFIKIITPIKSLAKFLIQFRVTIIAVFCILFIAFGIEIFTGDSVCYFIGNDDHIQNATNTLLQIHAMIVILPLSFLGIFTEISSQKYLGANIAKHILYYPKFRLNYIDVLLISLILLCLSCMISVLQILNWHPFLDFFDSIGLHPKYWVFKNWLAGGLTVFIFNFILIIIFTTYWISKRFKLDDIQKSILDYLVKDTIKHLQIYKPEVDYINKLYYNSSSIEKDLLDEEIKKAFNNTLLQSIEEAKEWLKLEGYNHLALKAWESYYIKLYDELKKTNETKKYDIFLDFYISKIAFDLLAKKI